jgi:hypothetical protein
MEVSGQLCASTVLSPEEKMSTYGYNGAEEKNLCPCQNGALTAQSDDVILLPEF